MKLLSVRAISIVVGLLLGIAFTEVALRILDFAPRSEDRRVIWGHFTYGTRDWKRKKEYFNSRYQYDSGVGFVRSELKELPPLKHPGEYRVVLLGDSLTEDEHYLSSIRSALGQHKRGKNVVLLNAGVIGYDTTLERRLLERYVLEWQPDHIVLQFCLNDFNSTPVIVPDGNGGWNAFNVGKMRWMFEQHWLSLSKIYQLTLSLSLYLFEAETFELSERRVEHELSRISTLLSQRNINFTLVLFPYLYGNQKQDPREQRIREIVKRLELIDYTLDLRKETPEIIREHYRKSPHDPSHINTSGYELTAPLIVSRIIAKIS